MSPQKRPNILQLIGSFNQGGSELQAIQLVKSLHNEGSFKIFPACLDRQGVLWPEFESLGFGEIPEFRLNSFYDLNMARQIFRCVRYIREKEIGIVQSHDFYTNVFGMLAGALARVPIRIAAKRETGTKTPGQLFSERRAYALSHAIVANSAAVRDHLARAGVASSKINVIYNGIDSERFAFSENRSRNQILQDLGIPDREGMRFVTIVANLRSEVKDHRMFLRAARSINEKELNVGFVIAGEGELTKGLMKYAGELDIVKKVFFTGRCADVPALLSVSDVCVLSSASEGFSNSILEYMAASKPVVATNVGGAREAVLDGETGYLVESGDDIAMADRIIRLLTDPAMAGEFGEAGRKKVGKEFSLKSQLDRTIELYRQLSDE